jgi:hypothetical protein
MGGDDVGVCGGRWRWNDPGFGFARGGGRLRVVERLRGLRYRLNRICDRLAGPLGNCLARVPLVILHRAMDLHQDRFGGLES